MGAYSGHGKYYVMGITPKSITSYSLIFPLSYKTEFNLKMQRDFAV